MKLTYVVSMFPCWSETFILNELVSHRQNGIDVDIFSIKTCNETMTHDEARAFIQNTTYGHSFLSPQLWLLHCVLIATSFLTYARVFSTLLLLRSTDRSVKIKSLAVFALAPSFIAAARQSKTTHLHAHFATYPALLAWIVGQFARIPFTFTAHAHDIYVNQDLLPLICRDAATVITISEFNKKFIMQKVGAHYEDKIHVVHCGIDLQKFTFDLKTDFCRNSVLKILSIGRLSGIKGFSYLIDALMLLRNDGVKFNCTIIGDGPLRGELEQRVRDAALEEEVHFLGSKKSAEIPQYLKDADVFVLACATDRIEGHDGIPVVFMEAMAYGTPVIGTRISGIPELIIEGSTGFCAEAENSSSLADTIIRYMQRTDLQQIAVNARKLVETEFDMRNNAEKLWEIISNRGGQCEF